MIDTNPLKRVQWRCRRGTKELDVLYGWWLDERWAQADAATRQAFDELLDAPDPDLWDWTLGRGHAPREDWQVIIDVIRAHHHL
jgi:antitoxin CptB